MDYLGAVIVAQPDCILVRERGQEPKKLTSAAAARTFIRRRRRSLSPRSGTAS
jgi:hypothetical protein